jgi:thymidylate synthase
MLEFQWAIEANKVRLINPKGTVAVCSLWTPVSHLEKIWAGQAQGLLDKESPLCLLGGLYGGGLKIMLRNLHHNPQIDTVILLGKDFSGTVEHLVNFFNNRVERTGQKGWYVFEDGSERELEKLLILGAETSHGLDELVRPELFKSPPAILDWTKELDNADPQKLARFLASYQPKSPAPLSRPDKIPLPRPLTKFFPSELAGHSFVAETILEAWDELLFRLYRFGALVKLRNGKERNELLNVKAVIRDPGRYALTDLSDRNLSESKIKEYQADLLKTEKDDGLGYTYGHRLGLYFGVNLLSQAIRDLAQNLDSRHAYATLWDNQKDPLGSDSPCLVSLFFRKIDGVVHLTATFRTHNGARAWPVNCFGLWGLLSHVCREANADPGKTEPQDLCPGQLIVMSHSISLDPSELTEVAGRLEKYQNRPYKMKKDPQGYFKLAIDPEKKEIVVWQFNHEDEIVAELRGRTPAEITRQLVGQLAISDLGHALYLGGQLERAWRCLELGQEYVQDKTKPVK